MKTLRPIVALQTLLAVLLVGLLSQSARAAQGDAERQRAIQKTAEAFVTAYGKGDANAIAALWLPDADYIDLAGRRITGRAAIQQAFADAFAQSPKMQLRIEVASLKFPTPQTAVEDGTTSILGPDGTVVSRAQYTNVMVEKDGKWLLSSVRESPYSPPSNSENLRSLEWAIGVWEHDADGGPVAVVSFDWTPDKNFIVSTQSVIVNGQALSNGSQMIAWDASAKQIRSWRFESDGGFGESTWSNSGQTWTIKTKSVLRSGSAMESTNVVKQIDADHIAVQTIDQKLDGKPLPNGPIMNMKRVN